MPKRKSNKVETIDDLVKEIETAEIEIKIELESGSKHNGDKTEKVISDNVYNVDNMRSELN